MKQKTKSEGKCVFCEKTYSKAGINRHLQTHFPQKITENKKGGSFLVKIEPHRDFWSGPGYFLSLWIDGETKMSELDHFLRNIWLECCGHLSAFRDPKARRSTGGMWGFFEAEELLEKGK